MHLQVRFPDAAVPATFASAAFAGKADSPAAQCARGLVDANAAAMQCAADDTFAVNVDLMVEAREGPGSDERLTVARPWSATAVT
jgi:hypothetical protein